jgi:hypothetical protein
MVYIEVIEEQTSMEGDVSNLADMFAASSISVKNQTPFTLYVNNNALYTKQIIMENTIIGEVYGDPAYIWEIQHTNYVLINNDMVLDVLRYMDLDISYVREENQSYQISNCYIRMITEKDCTTRFFLITKRVIMPNEELVYSTFDFVHTDLP